MTRRHSILALFALTLLTLVRFVFATYAPVLPEEAYYWMESHRLAGAFFEGPSGVSLLVKTGCALIGENALGLRMFFPFLAALASLGVVSLGGRLFGSMAGWGAALMLNVLPLFNLSAVFVNAMLPAMVGWLFVADGLHRVLTDPKRLPKQLQRGPKGWHWAWGECGIALAFGVQFQYAFLWALVILPICIAWMPKPVSPERTRSLSQQTPRSSRISGIARSGKKSKWIFQSGLKPDWGSPEWLQPGLYGALMLLLLGCLPAALWNWKEEWPFLFQPVWQNQGHWEQIWGRGGGLSALLSAYSVFGCCLLLGAMGCLIKQVRTDLGSRFLLIWAVPFIVLWGIQVWKGVGASELLLPLAAWTFPVLWKAAQSRHATDLQGRVQHAQNATEVPDHGWRSTLKKGEGWFCGVLPGCVIGCAVFTALALHAGSSESTLLKSSLAEQQLPWKTLARIVQMFRQEKEGQSSPGVFIIGKNAAFTAQLNYFLFQSTGQIPSDVFVRESQDLSHPLSFWPRYDEFKAVENAPDELFTELRAENPFRGRSAIYVTDEPLSDLPQCITNGFQQVTLIGSLALWHAETPRGPHANGQPGQKLYLYFCHSYQTLPL